MGNEIIAYNYSEDTYFLIPYSTGLDGEIKLGESKEQTQVFNDVIKAMESRTYRKALGELKASNSGPSMKIWGTGIHNVFVNDKPSRVKVPKETIPSAFEVFQKEIEDNGGITLGLDHLPEELLAQYPTLKKLNLLDVGQITEIGYNENSIYATKTEHTNPLVDELYAQGELENVSVVAPIRGEPCEDEDADYVLKEFKGIKRTDYVDEGGCRDCKTGLVPDDLVLTAKLGMEEDNVTDENNPGNPGEEGEGNPEEGEEAPGAQAAEGGGNPAEESTPQFVTKEEFDTRMSGIEDLIKSTAQGETAEVKAGLADMQLKARKAELTAKIGVKIKEGKITPAMEEGVLEACLAYKDDEGEEGKTADQKVDTMLASFKEQLWNPEEISRQTHDDGDGDFDYEKYKETCEEHGMTP